MSNRTRTRRKRRQFNASLKHPGAKPKHKSKSGRTGMVHKKQLQAKLKEQGRK